MVAHVATVAFLGLEARAVDVQVQIASGLPKFLVVGLPDKAVAESREKLIERHEKALYVRNRDLLEERALL